MGVRTVLGRPVKAWRAAYHWFGRRGRVLMILSVVFIGVGVKAIVSPVQDNGHLMFYALMPIEVRVALWFVAASLGLLAAFKMLKRDGIGFAALSVPSTIVLISHMGAAAAFLSGVTSYAGGWAELWGRVANILEWAAILGLLQEFAGAVELDDEPNPSELEIVNQTIVKLDETRVGGAA